MLLLIWNYIDFGKDHNRNVLLFIFPVGYPLNVDGGRGIVLILGETSNFFIAYLFYYFYFIFCYQHYYTSYTYNYCVEFKIHFEINISLSVKDRMMKCHQMRCFKHKACNTTMTIDVTDGNL